MALIIDEYNSCPTRTRHIWKRLHAQVKNLLKSTGRIWLLEIAWERKVRVSIEIMECVFDSLQALQNVWHAIEYQQRVNTHIPQDSIKQHEDENQWKRAFAKPPSRQSR
uniref:Uncharacterized protein n=1 Tax=Trichuris muris TaxID=70415 RepID=A0A5S6QCR9_TRIMR